MTRILVAGIGNIFKGDDGFGVEVVRRLAQRPLPSSVTVTDFGIRGIDLTYALLDGYEAAVLVDARSAANCPARFRSSSPSCPPPIPTPKTCSCRSTILTRRKCCGSSPRWAELAIAFCWSPANR
jgi:hydrogenase maturation protease